MSAKTKYDKRQAALGENEVVKLQWRGMLRTEEDKYPANFIATDNRLIYSVSKDHFKDIGLQYIESVEVSSNTESETYGIHPNHITGISALAIFLGIGAIFLWEFANFSIVIGALFMIIGGYGIYWARENHDRLIQNLETEKSEIFTIILYLNATSSNSTPVYIETHADVGPDVSKIVHNIE